MRVMRSATIVLALAATAVAVQAQGIPAGTGGQLSSLPGLAFDVPLVVDMSARAERLGSFAARLTWDPARLRLDASTSGSFGAVTSSTDSVAQGILRMAGANPAGAAGQVSIGLLRFTPLINDTASIGLTFSELYAAGTFADLRPSMTVTGGQFCPALGRFGDMDRDGSANSRDALIALSAAVGINVAPHDTVLGDVDASGLTNARDALGILTHAVGLPTPGFRVLAMALGSCATAGPITLAIAPGIIGTLVVGQFLQLEARASDGAGALQTVPDAIWRTSDASIAVIGPNGMVTARGPGTVLITALRAGQDSVGLSLTVAASRSRHIVDAAALQATNAIGTAAVPFGRLADAIRMARDGDTIQLRVGRYEPSSAPVLVPRLTIEGDTTAAGLRPVVAGLGLGAGTALTLSGTQRVTISDVAFADLFTAVEIGGGAGRVELMRTRAQNVQRVVSLTGSLGHLRVDRGRFVGNPLAYSSAAIDLNGATDTITITDTDLSDFGGDGVYAQDVDSVSIRRSRLHSLLGEGINLDNLEARSRGLALSIDSSTFRNTYDELIDAEDVRSVVIRWSTLDNRFDDLMSISSADGTGYVKLLSDSLLGEDMYWFDTDGLDSVLVDSVQGRAEDAYNYFYNVGLIRVRNSRFEGFYSLIDADLGGGSPTKQGGRIEVRNTQIVGSANCDRCGYAIEVDDDIAVVVDSVLFFNLGYAIEHYSDSNLTVTHSRFEHVDYAIEVDGNYSVGCPTCGNPNLTAFIQQNAFVDLYRAIEVDNASLTVDSNTFTNSQDEAIDFDSYGSLQVTRNRFDNVDYGIDAFLGDTSIAAVITDNVFTNVRYQGIEAEASGSFPDTLSIRYDISRNTVTCSGTGFSVGIHASDAQVLATDNVVSGCSYGMQIRNFNQNPRTDSILRNRINLPTGSEAGLIVEGRLQTLIRGNYMTGDSTSGSNYGLLYVYGYGYPFTRALIEQDTLLGGYRGMYAAELDTLTIRNNLLEDGGRNFSFAGGIDVSGSVGGDTVRIRGNIIRRADVGVHVHNNIATPVLVDSNVISKSRWAGIITSYSGNFLVRRNAIDSSARYGVMADPSGPLVMDSNNLQGNAFFGLNDQGLAVDARFNWWGDAAGPRCLSGCSGTSTGDSITPASTFTPFLTAPYGGAPPFGLRMDVMAARAVSAPRLTAAAGPVLVRRPRPVPPAARTAAAAPAARPTADMPAEMAERASRMSDARAAQASRKQQRRAEREQARAQERAAQIRDDAAAAAAREQRRASRPPSVPVRRP